MLNIESYLLGNASPATSLIASAAETACTINGQPCGATLPLGELFAFMGVFFVIMLAIGILIIVSLWKIYKKAGQPGWASIVPIYNYIVLLEMTGKPIWWIFLLFIPLVNIIFIIIIFHNLSKAFGQDVGFTLGMIFLPFIFYPMLAFGNYTYTKPTIDGQPQIPVAPSSATPSSMI